jgi:hypothetical protein
MQKSISILGFVVICSIAVFAQAGEKTVAFTEKLSFPGESELKRIPISIGSYFEFPASCARKQTHFITANEFVFPETSIGKIENCEMIYTCIADTLRKVTIVLKDEESVKQAGVQAGKQFGTPVYSKEGHLFVYRWNYKPRKKTALAIRLEVAQDAKSAVMFVEEG